MKKRNERQLSGVGGFIESILAVIIVSCGFILLSSAISIAIYGWENELTDSKMEEACRDVLNTIRSNKTIMVGENTIDPNIRLDGKDFLPKAGEFCGIQVIVTDAGSGEIYPLLNHGNETGGHRSHYICSEPVNIQISPIDLRPGLISVIVW